MRCCGGGLLGWQQVLQALRQLLEKCRKPLKKRDKDAKRARCPRSLSGAPVPFRKSPTQSGATLELSGLLVCFCWRFPAPCDAPCFVPEQKQQLSIDAVVVFYGYCYLDAVWHIHKLVLLAHVVAPLKSIIQSL